MKESMVIAPITNKEKQELINMHMQDDMVVLYRTKESNDIQIGMLSESIRKYLPECANIDKISKADELAYFVASSDTSIDINIQDRPVYLIKPTQDRKVSEYELLNGDIIEKRVWLEDVLGGNYMPQESFSFRNIM